MSGAAGNRFEAIGRKGGAGKKDARQSLLGDELETCL